MDIHDVPDIPETFSSNHLQDFVDVLFRNRDRGGIHELNAKDDRTFELGSSAVATFIDCYCERVVPDPDKAHSMAKDIKRRIFAKLVTAVLNARHASKVEENLGWKRTPPKAWLHKETLKSISTLKQLFSSSWISRILLQVINKSNDDEDAPYKHVFPPKQTPCSLRRQRNRIQGCAHCASGCDLLFTQNPGIEMTRSEVAAAFGITLDQAKKRIPACTALKRRSTSNNQESINRGRRI